MERREIVILFLILSIIATSLFIARLTGNIILQEDQFSNTNDSHWTHMPIIYSLEKSCDKRIYQIKNAFSVIENSTNMAVYFKEADNPGLTISCSILKNCYEKKTERRWFWIITTEAVCEHESGTAQITKIQGNKIINARINLFLVPETKNENCSETEIHEILHILNYDHSENPDSIMHSESSSDCIERIDPKIINDLMKKYSTS